MAIPTITSIHPPNNYNVFPITGSIEILFDQEISEEHVLNGLVLIGPEKMGFTGPLFNQDVTNGLPFSIGNRLNSISLKGEVPLDIEVYRCDLDGELLESQLSFAPDNEVCSKLVLTPKNLLQESTNYKLLLGGSATTSLNSITTRSVYDPEPDDENTGEGIILSSGYYTGETEDVLNVSVTRTGSSTTAKFRYSLESNPGDLEILLPVSGINKILNTIGLEFIGGDADAFQLGDTFSIVLIPGEQLEETYQLEFATGHEQIRSLPETVSQSPIGLNEPTDAQITEANEPFELLSVTPESGASNVTLTQSQIILTFSKPIDPTTVSHRTLKVLRNAVDKSQSPKTLVAFSWIVDNNRIILNIEREQNNE